MPCPFTVPKMLCASPNFLSQPKNLTAFSASSKTFVPAQKNNFTECKSSFCLAQNVGNKFLVWHKKLGPAQRYTYKVLQTIQMNRMLLWVWAEWAVLGRAKTALKFKYDIYIG